ncbi:hypothetical protein [Massiliimalia massiliensis]|jgi:hypothetical protein|uniref:hypothetical protein n=1 Tax=Massiliimalia massiliensis TaxID=1852384 RepID=UPI0013565DE5|nr:hypothetical protein [Massiliimalia massiliensis]
MQDTGHHDTRMEMARWFETGGDLDDFIFYWDTVAKPNAFSQEEIQSDEQR